MNLNSKLGYYRPPLAPFYKTFRHYLVYEGIFSNRYRLCTLRFNVPVETRIQKQHESPLGCICQQKGIHNSAPIIYTLNTPLTKAPTALEERCHAQLRIVWFEYNKSFCPCIECLINFALNTNFWHAVMEEVEKLHSMHQRSQGVWAGCSLIPYSVRSHQEYSSIKDDLTLCLQLVVQRSTDTFTQVNSKLYEQKLTNIALVRELLRCKVLTLLS